MRWLLAWRLLLLSRSRWFDSIPHLQTMNVQDYIKNKLKNSSSYELNPYDFKLLEKKGIEEFIYRKITSKKFRKFSLTPDAEAQIRKALTLNIERNEPIQFIFPFGGYKLWRVPSAPEVDWAEFFTIAYYLEFLSPILQVYKPGVDFCFSSDDVIIERMDNVSKSDTEVYFNSFKKLLQYFQENFPSNLQMYIKRVADLYSPKELNEELEDLLDEIEKTYDSSDEKRKSKMIKTSELNIQWKGKQDWSRLSEVEKREKVYQGPILHDAYCKLSRRTAFVRSQNKVVVFTTKIPNAIALGTTKTSITKFWTGFGVLESNGREFFERILSPNRIVESEKYASREESISGLELKNFDKIRIFNERFNYSSSRFSTR